jgi:hypothetical protein
MSFVHGVLTHEALLVLCLLVLPSTCCQLRSMLLLLVTRPQRWHTHFVDCSPLAIQTMWISIKHAKQLQFDANQVMGPA